MDNSPSSLFVALMNQLSNPQFSMHNGQVTPTNSLPIGARTLDPRLQQAEGNTLRGPSGDLYMMQNGVPVPAR